MVDRNDKDPILEVIIGECDTKTWAVRKLDIDIKAHHNWRVYTIYIVALELCGGKLQFIINIDIISTDRQPIC